MMAAEAAELLNGQRYKPGSVVVALPIGDDMVGMTFTFDSWDSTPEWDGSNRRAGFSSPPILIETRSLDEEGVLAAGLNAVIEVEIHEAREFWRQKNGARRAQFHPHNRSGDAAWQRTRAIPVEVLYPKPNGE